MSFRTVAQLDLNRTDVTRDLADRDRMHKRLMSLYPDGLGQNPRQAINLLFTANPLTGELLFQSDIPPVTGPLRDARNGYFTKVVTQPLIECGSFKEGDTVEYRLWFAAQERQTGTGKRIAVVDTTSVIAKASDVLSRCGLQVTSMHIDDTQEIRSARRKIKYTNIELIGQGRVTDADDLKHAIKIGVGSSRLWGSGVLLVEPMSIKG